MEKWRDYIPIYLRFCRTILIYPCFLLVWVLCMFSLSAFYSEERSIHIAAVIVGVLVFFSVLRTFADHDVEVNGACAESGAKGIRARCGVLLHRPAVLCELISFLLFMLILPPEAGFYSFSAAFGLEPTLSRFALKGIVLAVYLPLFFLVALWARLSAWQKYVEEHSYLTLRGEAAAPDLMSEVEARGTWLAHGMGEIGEEGMNPNVEGLGAEGRRWLRREESESNLIFKLLMVGAIYLFGGMALCLTVPVFVSAWNVLLAIGALRWWLPILLLAVLFGSVWALAALRALRIRRRLFKGLKNLAEECGFQIKAVKRPYSSLFRYRDGVNLQIIANEKTYDCQLFSAMRRHYEIFFSETGTVCCRRSVRFRRVELFSFTSQYQVEPTGENTRLCIVCPVPKIIYAGNEQWHRPIDTGERIGDYYVFTSTGVLNALRRNCIERDK